MESVVENLNIFNKTTTLPMGSKGFVMRVSKYYDDDEDDSQKSRAEECFLKSSTMTNKDIMNQASVRLHDDESFHAGIARYNENREEIDRRIALEYQQKVNQAEAKKKTQKCSRKLIKVRIAHQAEKAAKVVVEEEKVNVATSNVEASRCTLATLALERCRLKKLQVLEDVNQLLRSRSDGSLFERDIARAIKQIRGSMDNATKKVNAILKVFNDPRCPMSISMAAFAKKMVSSSSFCPNPFAHSYVMVCVTSQFPLAMDILLAEFHKASTYTVPKYDANLESAWDNEAYTRLHSVMSLYGALVQTDILGVTNSHGIEFGFTWLARFFKNNISPNDKASATALNAFLQTAGYGLHQRYESHFLKVVDAVRDYLARLSAKKNRHLEMVIECITGYLDDQKYLKEPQGRTM